VLNIKTQSIFIYSRIFMAIGKKPAKLSVEPFFESIKSVEYLSHF
tara:strand:- start:19 stop:153 length:135 start_codon:yes stop_codon:yes gene_type:complete